MDAMRATTGPHQAEALIGGRASITCNWGPLGGESENGSLDSDTRISEGAKVHSTG